MQNPFRCVNSSPEVIRLAVMMCIAIRCRCSRSRTYCSSVVSTSATRRCGSGGTGSVRCSPRRSKGGALITGHIRTGAGKLFVRINGETHYLWRAVDHEGQVLEVFVTKRRDRSAALKFLKRAMKRYGRPRSIVTDRLRSYRAAIKIVGVSDRHECGRWLNNRAENSHQPFRRREAAMARFRDIETLQKFASIHSSIHNHFNLERHLNRHDIFKRNRSAALAECHLLAA